MSEIIGRLVIFLVIVAIVGIVDLAIGLMIKKGDRS